MESSDEILSEVRTLEFSGPVGSITYCPTSSLCAIVVGPHAIELWRTDDYQQVTSFDVVGSAWQAVVSSELQRVASISLPAANSDSATLSLHDFCGNELHRVNTKDSRYGIALCNKSNQVATTRRYVDPEEKDVNYGEFHVVELLDLQLLNTGVLLRLPAGHDFASLRYCPTIHALAVVGTGVTLWDLHGPSMRWSDSLFDFGDVGGGGEALLACVSQDGSTVAVSWQLLSGGRIPVPLGNGVSVVDALSGSVESWHCFEQTNRVHDVYLSPRGRFLVANCEDDENRSSRSRPPAYTRIIDLLSKEIIFESRGIFDKGILSPDGRHLLTQSSGIPESATLWAMHADFADN